MPYKDPQQKRDADRRYYLAHREHLRALAEIWKKKNRPRHLFLMRRWHDANADCWRATHLQKVHGLTPERFQALVALQGGLCAICSEPETRRRKRGRPGTTPLHVDHDHATGEIRGLLCSRCNAALGFLRDREDLCAAAMEYLRRTKATNAA